MKEQTILNAWDLCQEASYWNKGLILASLYLPEFKESEVAQWSIEKRDIVLLHLRKVLFGNKFTNVCSCPECGEMLEWEFFYESLDLPALDDVPDNISISLKSSERSPKLRLPTTVDMLTENEDLVIQNCLHWPADTKLFTGDKANALRSRIFKKFDEVCVFSNLSFQLTCVNCSTRWESLFDILSYLWKEIDLWAQNFLNHVFILAKAFGWTEEEILNLSPNRRNHYLKLLHST
ncbi:MAG TPA: hypothetical protein VK941_13730 [Gillisia sp.]|nr:hypothetical protein [Gillisia sp.]